MISYSIFVVDDEQTIRNGITLALESEYEIRAFETAEEALEVFDEYLPDLVLLDIGLPGMNGIEALLRIRDISPECLVIMITAYEDSTTVINAMKQGAYDYIIKPLVLDALEVSIRRALESIRMRKEVQALQQAYIEENLPCFIAESHAIQDIMGFITKIAKSPDTPILIEGETGTGKELIAGAIHYRSPNFQGPFVILNCASLPQHLIESELFGYEKGAFSGAAAVGKKGLIEEAGGGTLFLDEVGDLSLDAQAKLLRFLESGEFYRVGGTKLMRVGTRVISATNKDIEHMLSDKSFRQDLYFRLGVVRVQLPSLNERPEDIIPLASHFMLEFSRKFHKQFTGIAEDVRKILKEHTWVGNVRELRNVIERAVLISDGPELKQEHLSLGRLGLRPSGPLDLPLLSCDGINLEAVEISVQRYYIETALTLAKGNETKAARLLGMNHHTFRYRRRKLQEGKA